MEATTTDELRAELTRRGIEWREWAKLRTPDYCTVFNARGIKWLVLENPNSHGMNLTNYRDDLILDEVIEATLGSSSCSNSERAAKDSEKDSDGRGECRNTEQLLLAWSFTCSECGVHSITEGEQFNYCPNCGRKVVGQ